MTIPGKSEYEILKHYKQIHFFTQCYEKYQEAKEVSGETRNFYRIGGSVICVSFAGKILEQMLGPALAHLKISEEKSPDFTICAWDTESTLVEMVPPPCNTASFTDRGDIWGFNSTRIKTAFHWIENSVNVMNLDTNTAVFWVKSAHSLPFWVQASPFRTIFHWWMEKNGGQLLHAAATGTNNGAILITGKGGVGKSTIALACLDMGMFYAGDDYVIVRFEPEPMVYSLYSSAKLNPGDKIKFKTLSGFEEKNTFAENEKTVLFLYPDFQKQVVEKMPLKAIFLPKIIYQPDSRIVPGKFWEAQRALSFTTMSQLPNVGLHTHDFISKLTHSLPRFILESGTNLSEIHQIIRNFLSNPSNFTAHATTDSHDAANPQARPLVSVVIPVFNGERFIKEAVDNILSQDYPALEIIVVDDGSTDKSKEVIEGLQVDIRYFRQENAGPASARNRGIKDVSGEFIAFLDVDDLWPANTLNLLVDEMLQYPGIQVIRGNAQIMEEEKNSGKFVFTGSPESAFQNYIGESLYRRSVFDKVGLFDITLRYGEDNDWYNRAYELNIPMKRIEDVTLLVRRHGQNMTEGKNLVELNKLRVFKKKLDRMRASGNQENPAT